MEASAFSFVDLGDAYTALMPVAPWEPPAIVAQAVESLCSQQLRPTRLVISCDGCPPAELRTVLETATLPTTILCGRGGEGVGPVLARGLTNCPTELVIRADADDISLPQRCAKQVALALTNPDVAAISSSVVEFFSDSQRPDAIRSVPIRPEAIHRKSRWRNPMNHPAVLLRRSAVLAVGNYRHCPSFEDYDLWLRLLKAGYQLQNIEEPMVLCRTGPSHIARRRGWVYCSREVSFFWRCGTEGLLPWFWILAILSMRLPLRLLPASLLRTVMLSLRQSPGFSRSSQT